MRHIEDAHHTALMDWIRLHPDIDAFTFHTPNGGRRNKIEAARFKAMGVKRGIPDFAIMIPRAGYHGLWVELKAPKPNDARVTSEQREWIDKLRRNHYVAEVCYGWDAGRELIERYMAMDNESWRVV